MRWPVTTVLILAVSVVHANGRPPGTTSIAASESGTLIAGVTFGVLVSRDEGATWRWICEDAVGYAGTWDPEYVITPRGTLIGTTYKGLGVSRDGGCSWPLVPSLGRAWIDDIALGRDGRVWAVTASTAANNDVFVSGDDAATFTSVGLHRERGFWKSVAIAASDPRVVYVSGYQRGEVPPDGGTAPLEWEILRSSDGGGTWEPRTVPPKPEEDDDILLLGVSATDPDLVFARVNAQEDQLLRSGDGGRTWSTVMTTQDNYAAFVAREEGGFLAGTVYSGVFLSDDGLTWLPATEQPRMSCAAEQPGGDLWTCGSNWIPDRFAFARSSDGQTWSKVLTFDQIHGPLACKRGTAQKEMCEESWPAIADSIGIRPPRVDAGVSPDAGTPSTPPPCGCGISLALVFFVPLVPPRARRRRSRSR
jgi:photosystem II stability/assembly factor-like uncharacterized protein